MDPATTHASAADNVEVVPGTTAAAAADEPPAKRMCDVPPSSAVSGAAETTAATESEPASLVPTEPETASLPSLVPADADANQQPKGIKVFVCLMLESVYGNDLGDKPRIIGFASLNKSTVTALRCIPIDSRMLNMADLAQPKTLTDAIASLVAHMDNNDPGELTLRQKTCIAKYSVECFKWEPLASGGDNCGTVASLGDMIQLRLDAVYDM